MTLEQAIAEGLKPPQTPEEKEEEEEEAPSSSAYPAGLSAREVEVLGLVAKGMTNVQVGKELFISPRTVNAHLNSVYSKLGFNSRVEATRFAVEHNLLP
jgi:DNA-binding NarL/FixJ family response regulator